MVHEMTTATPSHRTTILSRYQALTGLSRQQLYRQAARHGFQSKRKPRADKGVRKSGLTDRQVELVAALIHTTSREVKGPIMPVDRALEIAVDSGYIDDGRITTGGMQWILRSQGINARSLKAPEPKGHMRSLHPNHCHVFDVSVCIQYYLRGKKGLCIMDERDFYKNKLHNYAGIKARLLRYVIVDHFSGLFYFRYFEAAGETQNNLCAFLIDAWKDKGEARYPFRGVPFCLLMDQGAANSSRAVVSFLRRLEVEIPAGRPYNSARQGAVEVMHNIIERRFESGLRLDPASDLATLNAWAYDFCVADNARRAHTRTGITRTECWLMITPDQLREIPGPEVLSEIYSYTDDDFTRTVNRDYTISYKGDIYNLKHIEGIIPNASKVRIIIKPYTPGVIGVVFQDSTYEVHPVQVLPVELGGFRADAAVIGREFRALPESAVGQAKKRFENMAYGEDRKKDAPPFEGLRVFGHHADKVDIDYITRRGTPIEVSRAIVARRISMTDFLKRVRDAIGVISPDTNRDLRETYGDSIDVALAEEVIEDLKTRSSAAPESVRAAERR